MHTYRVCRFVHRQTIDSSRSIADVCLFCAGLPIARPWRIAVRILDKSRPTSNESLRTTTAKVLPKPATVCSRYESADERVAPLVCCPHRSCHWTHFTRRSRPGAHRLGGALQGEACCCGNLDRPSNWGSARWLTAPELYSGG